MQLTAAVITVSDKCHLGQRTDNSGPTLCLILESCGIKVVYTSIVPDEPEMIKSELIHCCDDLAVSLVLTTGGTGFSPRDNTPEVTISIAERMVPGIPELIRAQSMLTTTRACLSRAVSCIRRRTLIVNLPGSERACRQSILAVIDPIRHGLEMLLGEGSADCAELN